METDKSMTRPVLRRPDDDNDGLVALPPVPLVRQRLRVVGQGLRRLAARSPCRGARRRLDCRHRMRSRPQPLRSRGGAPHVPPDRVRAPRRAAHQPRSRDHERAACRDAQHDDQHARAPRGARGRCRRAAPGAPSPPPLIIRGPANSSVTARGARPTRAGLFFVFRVSRAATSISTARCDRRGAGN